MNPIKENAVIKIKGGKEERNLTSRDEYLYNMHSEEWKISRYHIVSLGWINPVFDERLQLIYRKVLSSYAQNNSSAYVITINYYVRGFIRFSSIASQASISLIKASHLINYHESLEPHRKYIIGQISSLLKRWFDLGYEGVDKGILDLVKEWKIKGAEKGRAVRTLCPYEGPLSDLEYESLHSGLNRSFEDGEIDLEELVLVRVFLATGRRPLQVCHLKIKDFIGLTASDGQKFYLLRIPKVKQRSAWRTSFSDFALSPELGILFETYIGQIKKKLLAIANLDEHYLQECPIFPTWHKLNSILKKFGIAQVKKELLISEMHRSSANMGEQLRKVVRRLGVTSERTGDVLHIFPLRLRRTLASRAAREGYGVLVIAKLLDHSDTQNAGVYTENTPEHLKNIDKAMALELTPIAQAFAGVLVDHESLAKRGGELSSRIRGAKTEGGVGTCGTHGFCTAYAPIACYTCHHFQPWLDGPHEIILDELIKKREEIITRTQDKTIASVNDRTIFAIGEVIKLCEERKAELNSGSVEVQYE